MGHRRAISTRRQFLGAAGSAALLTGFAPYYARAAGRPVFPHGVQSGDVDTASGMVWTRVDRPARVHVEVATVESFENAWHLPPQDATPSHDLAVKRLLAGLPSGQDVFYRFTAEALDDINQRSEPVVGRFRTAPKARRDVRFAWSGDTAGQGWGIDEAGMTTYATIARHDPDFLIHSGDTIYADGPMQDEVRLKSGEIWRNRVLIDEKRKVAETLGEFRAQWKYNMMDEHVRALNAVCPSFVQWDDHEVVDNWSDAKDLTADARYAVKSVPQLRARAAQAFHEMTPIRRNPQEPGRIYRKISYGPLLDVFFIDLRSYRGPNGASLETSLTPGARIFGARQIAWLKQALAASKATWKVIASDMPIGLVVWDDWKTRSGAEAVANGENGTPKGRELEVADLLRFIHTAGIANTVWLTADVHYTAAHHYDPARARFPDFTPFWEFVSGPLHAGTFGPNALDDTFGPEVRFVKAPAPGQGVNLPPSAGLQFFGLIDIDGASERLTVRLMDRADRELYKVTLDPAGPPRR